MPRQERIDIALSQLVEHLVPVYADDDNNAIDQRLDEAYAHAHHLIDQAGDSAIAADVHHAADLIRKKLIRDNVSPDKILRFSHLYSRLLAEPVLQQKWAVLYLLYILADTEPPAVLREARASLQQSRLAPPPSASASISTDQDDLLPSKPAAAAAAAAAAPRDFVVDSPAFNEAFSTAGLLKLPQNEDSRAAAARTDRPVSRHREKKEKQKEEISAEQPAAASSSSPAAPQTWITYDMAQPHEMALLRDLPFVLQGLSSTNLQFKSTESLQLPPTLPVPIISLLHTLAEPCLLYKSLAEFVEADGGGLVGQSFRAALGLELRSYLKLVATLEGQIRGALAMLKESQQPQSRGGIRQAGVTLKRCVYWTRDATMGLRLMSLMVAESKGKLRIPSP
jgi:gamma-tubulin complex component 3